MGPAQAQKARLRSRLRKSRPQRASIAPKSLISARTPEPANDTLELETGSPDFMDIAEDSLDEFETSDVAQAPSEANDNIFVGSLNDHEPPPFDAPDAADLVLDADALEEDAPFDPPDERAEVFGVKDFKGRELPPMDLDEPIETTKIPPVSASAAPAWPAREERALSEQPVPAISILAAWDHAEAGEVLSGLADDRLMARAEITLQSGGLDAAIDHFERERPNLLILDTRLNGADILTGLERLSEVIALGTKIIVIGAINDVTLLRALTARGVSQYIMAPTTRDDLVRAACRLFGDADKSYASRVIAVVGARGGVGASTLAHNLAWSIAERQDAGATLVDLDLSFGTAAFNFAQQPRQSVANALLAQEAVDDLLLESLTTRATKRLQILTAPATVERAFDLDPAAFEVVIARARRMSPYVILDLPHAWNAWVRQTLTAADEVIVVAAPDLASLRNTKNLLDQLKAAREGRADPVVALSMVGAPKRPEISLKDFAESVGSHPVATLAFDPQLFGAAAIAGQMIGEVAPQSKTAAMLDELATALTGRRIVERRKTPRVEGEPRRRPEAVEAKPATPPATEEGFAKKRRASLEARIVEIPAFTFKPVETKAEIEPAAAPAGTSDAAAEEPLVLTEQAPPINKDGYLEAMRKTAQAELGAAPIKRPHEEKPGRSRIAAAAFGLTAPLLLGGAWYVHTQSVAAPAPAQAIASTPAPPAATFAPSPTHLALEQAAQTGNLIAQYELATTFMQEDREQDGLTLLQSAADGGFAMAQYQLAKLYERGEGVEANLAIARQWTERAAGAGNTRAMHDLGVFFARAEGAPLDDAAASRWFRQAAEFNVADSQYNLGVLYEQGRGVTADPEAAFYWFILAARQGDEAASARVADLEPHLSPVQIESARARVEAFQPRAANPLANGDFGPRAWAQSAAQSTGAE